MIALLARFKSYFWIGGVTLVIGMILGGWTVKKFYNAGEIARLEKSIQLERQAREASEKALSNLQTETLHIQRDKIFVKQEVVKYVKDNSQCDLSRGAVSLLNLARGVPETPVLTDAEKQTISTVTKSAEIQYHADCATDYRQLAAEHDALVDFIENAWPK